MMERHCTWNAYHGMKLNYSKCVHTCHGSGSGAGGDLQVTVDGCMHTVKLQGGNGVIRYLGVFASTDSNSEEEVRHVRNKIERALWVIQHMELPL
jgi:hypothetical protein